MQCLHSLSLFLMVSTLNMVFLILSLVFSSSVFSRMFSCLIADVEAFTTRREISKSDLGWCKQTEEHLFFSPNLNLFDLISLHLNSSGFRFIQGVEKLCFIRPCHKAAILPWGTKKALFYHAKPHPHGFHCEA